MNLDDLRAVQVDERGTDSLQPLRATFYEDAAAYLADLRERRDRLADRVEDPFDSEEVRRLTDELATAEEVVEAIYERRVGKLLKQAGLAAAGLSTGEEGLTAEEAELFSTLVDRIEAHRAAVLTAFDGEGEVGATEGGRADDELAPDAEQAPTGEAGTPNEVGSDDAPPTASEEPAPAPDGEPETDASEADPEEVTDGGATERFTLRITRDVGEVFGVDERVYDLASEDVVTLPAANARPLLDRDAAERLD